MRQAAPALEDEGHPNFPLKCSIQARNDQSLVTDFMLCTIPTSIPGMHQAVDSWQRLTLFAAPADGIAGKRLSIAPFVERSSHASPDLEHP